MGDYFDLLPDEINLIIIFDLNVIDLESLYDVPYFKELFSKGKFWNSLVRLNFPKATPRVVPDYLINYGTGQVDFYAALINYESLTLAYRESEHLINSIKSNITGDQGSGVDETKKYLLSNITNFRLLPFFGTNFATSDEDIEFQERWLRNILTHSYRNSGYIYFLFIYENEEVNYYTYVHVGNTNNRSQLIENEVFDLLLHIHINGARKF